MTAILEVKFVVTFLATTINNKITLFLYFNLVFQNTAKDM